MTRQILPLTGLAIVLIIFGIISLILSLLFLSYRRDDHSRNELAIWITLILGISLLGISAILLIAEEFYEF